MKNNYNFERISRKAEAYQWTGENTDKILGFLARHNMIGELYREGQHIMIYREQIYFDTLAQGMWLVEGEDKALRIYENDTFQVKYQPINDELERLRAFAREIIDYWPHVALYGVQIGYIAKRYGLLIDAKPIAPCGDKSQCRCLRLDDIEDFEKGLVECYRLAESLKVTE